MNLSICCGVGTGVAPASRTITYEIDTAHASAQFKVRHLMVSSVRGELGPITGEIAFDANDPSRSTVVALINARELDTRNPQRDAHLRSADFFDVDKYPIVTFRSRQITAMRNGVFEVAGDLTICDITRPITLLVSMSDEIRDPWGNYKRGIEGLATVNRRDFGLTWNALLETGGVTVADVVEITIEAELVRRIDEAA